MVGLGLRQGWCQEEAEAPVTHAGGRRPRQAHWSVGGCALLMCVLGNRSLCGWGRAEAGLRQGINNFPFSGRESAILQT